METNQPEINVRDLYPDLTDEERAEAAAFLARYIDVVCRIYERTQNLTRSD